jgi:hypothetical protein
MNELSEAWEPLEAENGKSTALFRHASVLSGTLRASLVACLDRRTDKEEWIAIEGIARFHLKWHLEGVFKRSSQWYARSDRRLQDRVGRLVGHPVFRRDRMRQYKAAMTQLSRDAEGWSETLGEEHAAYWLHSAKLWSSLWHSADYLPAKPAQVRECLRHAFKYDPGDDGVAQLPASPRRMVRSHFAPLLRWRA